MIYLDTSGALAHLLAEDRAPPERLWEEPLISSRLIEYEIWTRIHARKLTRSHSDKVRALLSRLALIELAPPVLARAVERSEAGENVGRAAFGVYGLSPKARTVGNRC